MPHVSWSLLLGRARKGRRSNLVEPRQPGKHVCRAVRTVAYPAFRRRSGLPASRARRGVQRASSGRPALGPAGSGNGGRCRVPTSPGPQALGQALGMAARTHAEPGGPLHADQVGTGGGRGGQRGAWSVSRPGTCRYSPTAHGATHQECLSAGKALTASALLLQATPRGSASSVPANPRTSPAGAWGRARPGTASEDLGEFSGPSFASGTAGPARRRGPRPGRGPAPEPPRRRRNTASRMTSSVLLSGDGG